MNLAPDSAGKEVCDDGFQEGVELDGAGGQGMDKVKDGRKGIHDKKSAGYRRDNARR
jgi:hypothetical protein